jgi:competence protein ComEA
VSDEFTDPTRPPGAGQRLVRVLHGVASAPTGVPAPAAPEPEPDPPFGMVARLGGAAAFDPGRPGVRVLAAVAALVVLGAAVLAWWSRPRPEPLVPQLAATARPSPLATGATELVVAVTGRVREPGLVQLTPGARVADAIEAAGGVLPDAELDYLNLARKVVDGELIVVGIPPPPAEQTGAVSGAGGGVKINLNTATQAELETLPGVGPTLAQRIIDYRTRHGPFGSVSELRQVSGIGEVRFAELRDLVAV